MKQWVFFVLILGSLSACECYNILVIFPHIGRSHFLCFENLFKTLASKGNNVTVISFFPQTEAVRNYRDIVITDDKINSGMGVLSADMIRHPKHEMYAGMHLIAGFADISCSSILSNKNLHTFLKENNKFDLVMVELFNTNCHLGLAKQFGAPMIGLSSSIPLPWVNPLFALPDNPAYIPIILLDNNDQMSFLKRVENTVVLVFFKAVYEFLMRRPGIEYSKKYIGVDPDGVEYNISLFLVNSHFTSTRPRPMVPSVIDIAGLHIGEATPLPKDLETYINESEHGVIFMSMGTMLQGTSFPKDKKQNFQKAFSKIPQRVIWKYENETMDGKPKNVKITKWAPQRDILCHPNVKAFISHGGLLGTLEAIYCGVPIIIIPHFADQFNNAEILKINGNGIPMYMSEATEEIISKNLRKILSDEFAEQAKELSRRFKDRPQTPMETSLYWIEYVIRHKGAPFMKTAAVNMPAYKYYLLDVLGFLSIVLLGIISVFYYIVKLVLRAIFQQKTKLKKS